MSKLPIRPQNALTAGLLICVGVPALFLNRQAAAHGRPDSAGVRTGASRLNIVIDHDPMRMTVGSPPSVVMRSPPGGPPAVPTKEQVTPDPSLNQIVVERPTPIFVFTGNTAQTSERLRLECYGSLGRKHGLLSLRRLTEGEHGDYSIAAATTPISQGEASFTIRFHRNVLGRPHAHGSRTVYLVTFKDTETSRGDGDDCIQTVTILSDDPAAMRGTGNDSSDRK